MMAAAVGEKYLYKPHYVIDVFFYLMDSDLQQSLGVFKGRVGS